MQVSCRTEAYTPQGEPLQRITLLSGNGSYIELTNYGARWIAAWVPDAKGHLSNVLLGYSHISDYLDDSFYLGATIGRFANRIAHAQFEIDGVTYHIDRNDGANCNHGGLCGLHQKVWQTKLLPDGVAFYTTSNDGEGGWPGNVEFRVEYHWSDDMQLSVCHRAATDQKTWINLTNHAYFNLTGDSNTRIDNHQLHIPSDTILETTADFVPTGKRVPVQDSPFDFQNMRPIGQFLQTDNDQLRWNRGYNHCYLLSDNGESKLKHAATVYEPSTTRTLKVYTDLPSVLFYSAGYIPNPTTGLCLEAQYYPDTPHHPHFPQGCLLSPGQEYLHHIVYCFSCN